MGKNVIAVNSACIMLVISGSAVSAAPNCGTIEGHVLDFAGKPLANAQVLLPGTGYCARTDSAGSYNFSGVDTGFRTIKVSAFNYRPASSLVAVKSDTVSMLNFRLEKIIKIMRPGTIIRTSVPHPEVFYLRSIPQNLQPPRQNRNR